MVRSVGRKSSKGIGLNRSAMQIHKRREALVSRTLGHLPLFGDVSSIRLYSISVGVHIVMQTKRINEECCPIESSTPSYLYSATLPPFLNA